MSKSALEFLKAAKGRIVSSGDLTTHQIAEFRAHGSLFHKYKVNRIEDGQS